MILGRVLVPRRKRSFCLLGRYRMLSAALSLLSGLGGEGESLAGLRRYPVHPDRVETVTPEARSDEEALRSKFMLIFRGGAVTRHDLSPSELQAHVEKWYRWSDELARQGRHNGGHNGGTALGNEGAAIRGRERVVTDGPYAESKDLVTGSLIIEAASLEDAVDVARTCPIYEFGGSVEVRPVQG
ncbi:MAG: YciI family protein [Streptosporangiaceae bacterium]